MTLLLATLSSDEVFITSDGLSIVEKFNAPGRTTLQKIFPIPSRPIAVAQCGGNFLKIDARGEVSIGKVIAEWYESELPQTVELVAHSLNEWIRTADKKFFSRSEPKLWVAGYSEGSLQPDFYYLTNTGVEPKEEPQHKAGAGEQFLQGQTWSSHAEAWHIATARQQEQSTFLFGGHRHQLRITSARWTWVGKPTYGTLGIEGDILPSIDISLKEKVHDPRCVILWSREELRTQLCRRALKSKGKHPTTYGGAKDPNHWKGEWSPDWDLTDRLIAVCDEARFAHPADVSKRDALLYREHVAQVINSLPNAIGG